jgi:TPP-dependent pyruvate/acetoin dehydrogenase alpha subunit
MSFFGDGATNIGAFHEGLNLSAVWKLPVIFICENNLYAVTTPIGETSSLKDLSERAHAYGIPGFTVDGNDIEAVFTSASQAVKRARKGNGPTLIECKTYRHGGHSRTDPGTYRPGREVAEWKKQDPLLRCRDLLLKRGCISERDCEVLEKNEERVVEDAAIFAIASAQPDPEGALKDTFANSLNK